jgi:hypothetical protein
MGRETLHRVMYGLLYPAVLGSVFVTFISVDLSDFGFYPRVIFGLIFIYHWSLQFAFATATHRIENYSLSKFCGDIFLIVGMNVAFYSLPSPADFDSDDLNYSWFYFGLFIIGLSFVVRELYDWKYKNHTIRKAPFFIDSCLLVIGLAMFFISINFISVSRNTVICFIAIFSTLLASILDTLFSKQTEDYESIIK